jgi:drug/metabolite transporter (DMT)-like permease
VASTSTQSGRADVPVAVTLGLAVAIAGAAYPVTGSALRFTSPAVVAVSRALVGGLIMLPLLRAVGGRLPATTREWTTALGIGFCNTTLTLAGISEGTRLAGPAVASVLLNTAPFFAALLARVFLAERISALRASGMTIAFAGVLLIVGGGSTSNGTHVTLGTAICLAGAVSWAVAGLAMRHQTMSDPSLDIYGATTAQFLCGGVLLIPYLIATGGTSGTDSSAPRMWLCLVFLILGAQIVTYVGFNGALRYWPSARVFAWTFLAPAFAVTIEAVLGALPGTVSTIGLLVVIAGVAVVNLPAAERS